jgi:hypothetical protein
MASKDTKVTTGGDAWLVEPTSKSLVDSGVVKTETTTTTHVKDVQRRAAGTHGSSSADDEERKKMLAKIAAGVAGVAIVLFGIQQYRETRGEAGIREDKEKVKRKANEAKGWFGDRAGDVKHAGGKAVHVVENQAHHVADAAKSAKDHVKDSVHHADDKARLREREAEAARKAEDAKQRAKDETKKASIWGKDKAAQAKEAVTGHPQERAGPGCVIM